MRIVVAVLGLVLALWGQDRRKVDINTETPEGQLLQQIGQEQDQAKKTALMEDFTAKHPKHNSAAWVWGQLHAAYVKSNQHDKVFTATEKLMSFDPADGEMAYGALQAAVAKNDPDQIIKWAQSTNDAAKRGVNLPKPANEDDEEMWKYRVEFSKQVQKRAEYELFTGALRTADPATKLKMMDGLTQMSPGSEYVPQLDEQYFLTYRQLGQNDKALAVAEKAAGKNTANEDMLLLLANNAFEKKDNDNVVAYSDKLVAYLKDRPAPQGVNPAEWDKKKNTSMGAGLWLKGMAYASQQKWRETDEALRPAIPMLEGNEQLLGPALFQLGLANYRMGEKGGPKGTADLQKIGDALRYNQQCAAIKGPFQAQAQKNIGVIRQQFPTAGAPPKPPAAKPGTGKKK